MKVLYLGSNQKNNSGKELQKIEIYWKEVESELFEKKKNVKTSKENLIIWSKYRWDVDKWIFGKLTSLIF